MIHRLHRCMGDVRGAAALEFALVAPAFLLVIVGLFDLGHIMLVDSMLHGAIEKAGRDSTLQTGSAAAATIDANVRSQVRAAVPDASITSTRRSYQDFANIGKPEPFFDGNGNATRDPTACFQDVNANSTWDTDASTAGQGGASQVAVYTVAVTYQHWFPLPQLIGLVTGTPQQSGSVNLSASTVLRNQPFSNPTVPRIICT